MLEIKNLKAGVDGKNILKGVNLKINAGEVHAIMGTNGSGKSTLASILAGNEKFDVTEGEIIFKGKNILDMPADQRAKEGIFLAFQYPVEIPGVTNNVFLKTSVNSHRVYKGLPELSGAEFLKYMKEKSKIINLDTNLAKRFVNSGFSGGEKKKNEIFQMAMLEPKLSILDETDSGLDIDALKVVSNGVNKFKTKDNAIIVITHYQRLLNYIVPDFVHVFHNGKIMKTGGKELALELENKGYDWIKA